MTQRTRSANLGGTVVTSTQVILASGLDVSNQANAAYAQANAAYNAANNAQVTVFSNNASDVTTQKINFINTATITVSVSNSSGNANVSFTAVGGAAYDQANAAYAQANNARSDANNTFATINTSLGTINTTFGTVNTAVTSAHNQANAAYGAANTRLSTSGGSISGDLAITGNLTVTGNATTINVSNLSVNDSMILLSTNAVGDSNDIGFIGHFDRGATATHAGLIRKATQNQFYLFDNYEVEPTNNVIDVTGNNFRVGNLRLGIINANSFVTSAGLNVTDQANAAFAAANNRVLRAGDTMTGQLSIQADAGNEQLRIVRSSNANQQLIFGFHSSNYGWIQSIEQNVAYRPLVLNRDGGNVGIGTTNPQGKLTISNAGAEGIEFITSGGVGNGPYFNAYNRSTSRYVPFTYYANTHTFYANTGSTRALDIDISGNIGIGVTSPGHRLEVSGSLNHRDAYATIGSYNSGGQNTPFGRGGTTFGTNITNGQAEVNIWNPFDPTVYTSTGLLFSQALSATTRRDLMFLKHNGLVGIGTNSPNSTLHIVTSSVTAPILRMETAGNSQNSVVWIEDQDANPAAKAIATFDLSAGLGLFNLYGGAYTLNSANYYASTRGASRMALTDATIATYVSSSATGTAGGAVTWYQTLNMSNTDFIIYTNNGTERARVNSAGNFGIGTSSPAYRLDVDSTSGIGVKVATGGYNWLNLISGYTGQLSIGLNDSGGSGALGINQYNSSGAFVRVAASLDSSGHATFNNRVGVNAAATDTTFVFAVASGRTRLQANSEQYALGLRYNTTTGYYYIGASNSGSPALQFSNNAGTERARLSDAGGFSVGTTADPGTGGIFATGDITAFYSDDRLKNRLGNIDNALSKILTLNGFYYEPNQTAMDLGYEKKKQVGVSAQEVKEVLPEVVVAAPIDDKYMTVHYHKLVPLLIEAIKELNTKIEDMQKIIESKS